MKKSLKNIFSTLIISSLVFLNIESTEAAYLLYEKATTEAVTKGVTYTKNQQVTGDGLRDVHVLRVKTDDPNIRINNTSSKKDYNLKETVSSLLAGNGAVAGVNGDFFNMSGTHSVVQGPSVNGSRIIATDHVNNLYKDEYAAFVMTDDGQSFIDYIKTNIKFEIVGKADIDIFYYNKVPTMDYPVYVDGNAMSDTSPVDSKFSNVYKIVVSNNKVSYISKKGEVVNIPPDGYVILINEKGADYFLSLPSIGDEVKMKFSSTFDYNNLYTAVGGGGKILSNGQLVYDEGFVATGRQPRTVLGINKDGSEVVLMAIDGRGTSIGATHEETAELLLRYGVYNAMHLDGGGSTTMVVKTAEEDELSLKNKPSDGAERKVVNAVGVYNNSEKGAIKEIVIKPDSTKMIEGIGTIYYVFGYDEYLNKIDLAPDRINISSSDENGVFTNGKFYPSKSGDIILRASYDGLETETKVSASKLVELIPDVSKLTLQTGEQKSVGISGKGINGNIEKIYDGVTYEVYPQTLGTMEGNVFTAKTEGVGYIKINVLNVSYYLDVVVGLKDALISSFENLEIFYEGSPREIEGKAELTTENVIDGERAIALTYKFNESNETQIAYAMIKNRLKLEGDPRELKFGAFGDNSGNWLRIRIIDSNGKGFLIDAAKSIDWYGYKEVTSYIPPEVVYPIYLDSIYVASLSNKDVTPHTLYFDKLMGKVAPGGSPERPANVSYTDYLKRDLSGIQGFDITLVGDIASANAQKPGNYLEVQQKAVNKLSENSQKVLFAGTSDFSGNVPASTLKYGSYYGYYSHENVGIMFMTNQSGSFYKSNIDQWSKFENEIKASGKQHVIIETELNPLTMSNSTEANLWHNALADLKDSGVNIFVVSTEGNQTKITVKDGIRYINLGGLFKSDNNFNSEFRVLRMRFNGNEVYYNFDEI